VIVYLTHWFPSRERTRALSLFLIATPISQIIGPPLSGLMMGIGVGTRARVLGLVGWQWVFIVWGIPAVLLGFVVLVYLTDRPRNARWLTAEERDALEAELQREKAEHHGATGHMTIGQALGNSKILLLAAAYFFVVTGNYGVEFYMASILKDWYDLDVNKVTLFDFSSVTWVIIIPPIGSLLGQLFIGWNSDRTRERRWHATLPIVFGAVALACTPHTKGSLWLSVAFFTAAMAGVKGYLPAFWALPSFLMIASAAAASIGLINSFGNLGGWVGPTIVGSVKQYYDEHVKGDLGYSYGLWFLAGSMIVSSAIIASLGIGRRQATDHARREPVIETSQIDPI
jgi:ACS family tartrate transporter-like MFS transporter